MSCVIVTKIKVQNFDTYKTQYDKGESLRREFHVRGIMLLRDVSEPNTVTVVTRFDSVEAAKKMIASDQWKEVSRSAPATFVEMFYTEVAEEKTY